MCEKCRTDTHIQKYQRKSQLLAAVARETPPREEKATIKWAVGNDPQFHSLMTGEHTEGG